MRKRERDTDLGVNVIICEEKPTERDVEGYKRPGTGLLAVSGCLALEYAIFKPDERSPG